VQFNDSGVLGGDADLTWDKTANALSIGPLPALSGAIRIPYNTPLTARNSANTGDLALIQAAGGVVVVGNASVITKVVSGTHGIEINPSGWIYPVVDNGTDLGHATKRWKDVQVAGSVNIGTNPATTGAVRLANNSVIAARDVAGAADLLVAQIFTDNKIYVGSNANDAGLVLRSATAVEVNRGIKFPATAVPSADVNTLDDYREGNWTPTLSGNTGGSGQVYVTQLGSYVKAGRQVTLHGSVGLSNYGVMSGTSLVLGGFPFPCGAQNAIIRIDYWDVLTAPIVGITGYIAAGASAASLYSLAPGGQTAAFGSPFALTLLNHTSGFAFTLSYLANQ